MMTTEPERPVPPDVDLKTGAPRWALDVYLSSMATTSVVRETLRGPVGRGGTHGQDVKIIPQGLDFGGWEWRGSSRG